MALYRQDSTGFLCEFASSPGAGYTAVTAMPGDTEGRVTWWRDRCVDAALGQASEWHPTLAGTAESSTGRSGDGKNYLPFIYAPIVRDPTYGTGDIPLYWDGASSNVYTTPYPPGPISGTGTEILAYASTQTLHLGSSATDYNTTLIPYSRWLLSVWARPASGGARTFKFRIRASGGTYYTSATLTTATAYDVWVRYSAVVDMVASSSTTGVVCLQLGGSGGANAVIFDGLMMERQTDNGTVPSAFVPGVS